VDDALRTELAPADPPAAERYLLLADISGYTSFMAGVEQEHGADFSAGVPAAYSILGALLDSVIVGLGPEGDAVFAASSASTLDGQGQRVLQTIAATYRAFADARTRAIPSSDHVCTACPAVAQLDLKVILHLGHTVRQSVGATSDLLGPAVTVAHRLLKNTIRDKIGDRPYLFLTERAASALGLPDVGTAHAETYADAGRIEGRVIGLGEPTPRATVPDRPV
jgi:class 3 adenylate cyclase